ncbi:long-chain fatty acid--CoA ligase [Streptomyces sp. NEAU-YJ-81]|uniref:long-chain fatty acid--CoA ligase n=1 Tax=Streptomyces sp. NEAU-YJ-81 TaxID=2820288 RepID=UPI001ABC7E3D|nr:long-chain fatty acid--CoA ligase [Streptomyces sp. NEAU-YJ-81]MBO3678248.1 long-chain fatty acid--CoA ligase [Streptomyces sp. NEAU-YJ-81]
MLSTMQDVPLTLARVLNHGSTVFGNSTVTTWSESHPPRRRSYGETGARAARLAHALREELGIRDGDRVATFMWNNAEHLEAYLAIPAMGAVLHTLNLRLAPHQLSWIVNHAADAVIIVDGSLLPLLAPVLSGLSSVEHLIVAGPGDHSGLDEALTARRRAGRGIHVHDYEELIAARPEEYPWREDIDERSAAALCYTSGTTGNPKGVVYSHRSIYLHSLQLQAAEAFALSSADTALPVVPMFHVNAWGIPHAAFMTGASLLMPDRFLQGAPLADMIAAERPTLAAAVPTVWAALLAELDARQRDVSSLRTAIVGGSACAPSLMRDLESRHGVRVLQAWGMTETSPLGALARPPADVDPEQAWKYRVTQGRVPASVQARLVGLSGAPVPHDGRTSGELQVRGPWITGSYYEGAHPAAPSDPQTPEAHERFDGDWLRTGDIATLTPDGYLTITDRAKDLIKSGGEWISSVELENRLMAHPAVTEAAVVAVPDERWGERPLAAVVLRPDEDITFGPLRDFLAGHVAPWQLPDHWVSLPSLPKTSVGKLDKKALRARYADGKLGTTRVPGRREPSA